MIKYVVVICFLNAFSSLADKYPPADLEQVLNEWHDKCTNSIGVSDDEVRKYQFTDDSRKMKCYLYCILIESKWGKPDGTLDYDLAKENCADSIRDIFIPVIDACRDTPKSSDECENAYNVHRCIYDHDPEHWYLP